MDTSDMVQRKNNLYLVRMAQMLPFLLKHQSVALGARRVAMLLVTLLLTMTAQTAWADSWPEYITDVILVGGTESEVNAAKAAHSDYTFISQDLNAGCGSSSDFIYLGYKKGSRNSANGGYITDLIVVTEGSNPIPTDDITFSGRTYKKANFYGGDWFVNNVKGDLNSHAGGWGLWLYYTKANFSDKRAVSSISFSSTQSGSVNCYNYWNKELAQEGINMNRGCDGGDNFYMHLSTTTKTNRPSSDPTMKTGLTYTGQPQQLVDYNPTSCTMGYRIGNTGSFIYNVSNVTATNVGTYTVYYIAESDDYGARSEISTSHSKTVTIGLSNNKGAYIVSCPNVIEGSDYDLSNAIVVDKGLSTGKVTFTFSQTEEGNYSSFDSSKLGTWYVKATIAGDNNCEAVTTAAASFQVITDWAKYHGGDSEDDAYIISTPEQLDLLAKRVNAGNNYWGKFFKLANDITYNKNIENNYTPIGKRTGGEDYFSGTFDGNGKTISGLNMNLSETENVGLFGYTYYATIKNLRISNSTIAGLRYVGGIVGFGGDRNTIVQNCVVTNDVIVSGTSIDVGGIAGLYATVRGCVSAATVSGMQFTGGIIGYGDGTSLEHCLYTGNSVTASADCPYGGAIIGKLGAAMTANYYTQVTIGGVGNDDYTISSDENGARKALAIGTDKDVTITTTGEATTYNVSGITTYADNSGIKYNNTFYAGATEIVKLNISYNGNVSSYNYILNGFTDGNGNVLPKNDDGTYTLTMTNDAPTIKPVLVSVWGRVLGRNGSAEKPYLITTAAELDMLARSVLSANDRDKYFELGADIVYDKSQENNFTPIGISEPTIKQFAGHFDGKGHTISGININLPNIPYVGIFGYIASGTVKNLTLSNSSIIGHHDVGGILGCANDGATIENCHVTSDVTISSTESVGGIAGSIIGGSMSGCTSAGAVNGSGGSGYYVGGIAGYNNSCTIQDCLYKGNSVTSTSNIYVGAILGYNQNDYGMLNNNYHTLSGFGGVGNESDANGRDKVGACIAIVASSMPNGFGDVTMTYGTDTYTGIKAYGSNGLEYDGQYYSPQTVIPSVTTAIGTLDTLTGEVTFDSDGWYSLNGLKLNGKPHAKGLYINNGKKVVIK